MITSRVWLLPPSKAALAVGDFACVGGALLTSVALRLGWDEGLRYLHDRLPALLVVAVVFPLAFYVCGLYDTCRLRSASSAVLPAIVSVTIASFLGGGVWYATSSPSVGRGVALEFALLVLGGILAGRIVYARTRGMLKSRCLIIGSHELAADVMRLLREHPDAGIKIVGLIPHVEDRRRAGNDPAIPRGFSVLGPLDALDELVATHRIDRLILPSALRTRPALLRRLRPLRYRGVALVDFVSLYEDLAREIPLEHIDEDWLFTAATMSSQLHIRRLKRVTDVVASLILLVPAMPVLLVAALAIKLTSRGPVLFRQERAGLGSKPFMVLKLRTMYEDAETLSGPVWSMHGDPRITPIGRLLRKFRIDELPQLFNVLRGDMSLVGPRPERPVFVQQLSKVVPFYSERLLVRPGITGWAQVMAAYAASVEDSARKLQFDLYYAKNLSFALDVLVLLKTVKTVLFGRERVQGGMAAGQQLASVPPSAYLDVQTAGAVLPPRPLVEAVAGTIAYPKESERSEIARA